MIGSVSYLNARPLLFGIPREELTLEVPSRLAQTFSAGGMDAALLPIFDTLRRGGGRLVEGVAIACLGAVRSVLVVSPRPLAVCGVVHEDPSSLTSNALLRVLAAEFLSGGLRVVPDPPKGDAARVVIGDRALEAWKESGKYHITDLGEFWFEQTGLPFVFAAWRLASGAGRELADRLRGVAARGCAARGEIAAAEPDPGLALEYLTRYIRFELGDAEKKAVRLFAELAFKHGLLEKEPEICWV